VGGIEERGGDGVTAALILGLVLVAQAASVSVTELLADPDCFNGQPAMVVGTISGYREGATLRGSRYYTFDLSDGFETVPVIALEEPPCRSGPGTVEGTFERWSMMIYSLDAITVQSVICPSREALKH
jgi:hypothetical protein